MRWWAPAIVLAAIATIAGGARAQQAHGLLVGGIDAPEGVDVAAVRRMVWAHRDAVGACAAGEGSVALRVRIGSDGRVAVVVPARDVSASLACLATAVRGWTIAVAPSAPAEVAIRLRYRSAGYADGAPPRRGPPIPTVQLEVVSRAGPLARGAIRRALARHANEIRFCYEQELARDPSLAGEVIVTWTISPDGAVVDPAVESSTLPSETAVACMRHATTRWTFPPAAAPTTVRARFRARAAER